MHQACELPRSGIDFELSFAIHALERFDLIGIEATASAMSLAFDEIVTSGGGVWRRYTATRLEGIDRRAPQRLDAILP